MPSLTAGLRTQPSTLLEVTVSSVAIFHTASPHRRTSSAAVQLSPFNLHLFLDGVNGMMEPWLESKGLEDANQVLAYFAVSKIGETPIDGRTDTNPKRLIAAYGKWASIVAARLNVGGLSCKVLDKEVFQKQMLEKLIWICSVMLDGAPHGGVLVGVADKEFCTEGMVGFFALGDWSHLV
ncbi:hypothetical protein JHK85_048909 [Glycine max]|nr:hypothetical protein JHK85_048909 [Glycine max]KAH1119458.1 hypothetical protein GYH30_048015 [Glycine max]